MNDAQLMTCLPEAAVDSETDEETGHTILRKPRYGQTWLGRLLTRRLAKPWVHIHLDDLGTWIWQRLDGEHSLADLAVEMRQAFPDEKKPDQRLIMFVRQLVGTGLMRIRLPADDS
jgi:Coenzyme PQQ synthesis protein D (PqqD)